MADVKISELPAASTPLAGTEQIPLVQDATTKQVTVSNLLTSANLGTPSAINLANATNVPMDEASGVLAVANGGTGTATPALVQGTNVTITGTWPNQTINSTYSGAVTSVTGTAPVVSSGGTTPAISMAAATGSVSGYLTSTDWTTFNSKQPAGSYLTNGGALGTPSSGTATNLTGLPLSTGVTGLLPVANGGTGTATPNLVAGSNVTISGTWPNQTIAAAGAAQVYPGAGIANSTGSAWGTSYSTTGSGTVLALATSPTFVTPVLGTPTSGNFSTGTFTWPTFNQNTTGTAANITATSNSTLTTLSALSLPGSQVSGNISGNAANVTGIVAVANGGTGTATPALVAGTNVTITGTWPNQTIAASGGGGSGTVTSVSGTGTVNGLTLTGTVTTSGSLTLGGTLDLSSPPAIGGTAAAAGAFTTLSASSTVTLSGGTANGVTYLNGSKVLTSGSALTFDGTNFGVGTSAPAQKLQVVSASGGTTARFSNTNTGNFIDFYETTTSTRLGYIGTTDGTNWTIHNDKNGYLAFDLNNTEQMRLTSTGLGIGTSSPAYKLDVVGAGVFKLDGSGSTTPLILRNNNTASTQLVKLGFDSNGAIKASINAAVYGNDYMTFNVGSDTERMRLDSAGNLGLGVTPSAWGSAYKALQLNAGSFSGNAGAIGYEQNAYNNGSNWIYRTTAAATHYETYGGGHYWFNAPSGTAGNAISFTQALTLDASGNLLVGTTTAGDGARFTVTRTSVTTASLQQTDSNYSCAEIVNSGASGTRYLLSFRKVSGGANVGTITHDGSNTSYNTSSDYRLKENIAPMTGALTTIAQLKPCTYTWKVDGASGQGFIAHELAEVCPHAVTGEKDAVDKEGNPKYQGIDTSFLVATLTAAIQELKAEFDAYKASHP
ncbi:Intramolecular chaperone auto-processing domain containing protein [uncultured Caudovirales phage]|uniref:Intramolecular chaperone auto-processing domain containing protein n=1 Tax=uncultured Caudovirales phage TaxID=2100421 RepID=A0A6J7WBK5_9CAUD|nr:Intramolecular chaperone auto-processing domain containing protein [uncultured Caudovirales phage]